MSIDKFVITILDIAAIAFVYWFFLMKKENAVNATDSINIIVDGGYNPETIVVEKGKKTTITFLRKDPSSCLEEVVIADFNIRKFLPLNKKVSVEITPPDKGEFPFSCGMGMYHGKLISK